ncbi:YsnF/AvaK domain-containing protein [Paenibacillus wulumuqiensis]|uniref:YsnF/AvaK domain-containing protein n=1 Tax=Paenibacillus wulumuqiensis TaxID=1567107 RepID=UPI000ADFEA08|nr:YsnF/AvaK domain-containing protein [Paenibacillus wulumuqiensis]
MMMNNQNNENNRNMDLNNETRKIVGVFTNENEASNAIQQLKDAGFSTDDISVVSKNRKDVKHINEETGTKAPEGLATGAATGGVVGGVAGLLAGLGLAAIPVFGPIMAAGPIAVTLAGAAAGAGAGGLVGGLIGLGIPEEEAREYETNVNEGNILVMVDSAAGNRNRIYDIFRANNATNSRYYDNETTIPDTTATNTTPTPSTTVNGAPGTSATAATAANMDGVFDSGEDEQSLRLREERLDVSKDNVRTGEVEIRKEVVEEQKTINVPVNHEEVVIERRAINNEVTNEPVGQSEQIRIPVSEEQVHVDKHNVVTGEVEVHKQTVQNTEQVQDTVKREEARINQTGQPIVSGDQTRTTTTGTAGVTGTPGTTTGAAGTTGRVDNTHDESLKERGKDMLENGKDAINRMKH